MQFFTKKYFICTFLIFSMLANVVAQENKFSFTWLDQYEKKMAGNLTVNLLPQPGDGLYQLDFTVTWFDEDGNPKVGVSQMPFLCLSKWDFISQPEKYVKCTSFEQRKPFSLCFQSSDKLDFQVLNGYEREVEFTAHFQYALTREKWESGKSEMVDLKGTNNLKMIFQIKSNKQVVESDIVADQKQALSGAINYEAAVRRASENYQKIQIQVKDFTDHQSIDEFGRPNYLQDLEVLSAKIEIEKDRLNSDSLPADTFQQYHGRYKSLNDTVLLLRTACLKFKLSKSNQGNVADSLNRIQKGDSLRNLVRNPYEPIIPPQGDTLNQNVRDQKPIAVETPWYMSNRLIWTGLLAILILVFVSAIWSSARNKKILKERLTFLENGNAVNQQGKSLITGIFTNEVPDEYFTVNYQETIPESVVGKVHYHNSSIKSVYQLVHAALLERKGGDFGGYFFGNQYKLSGKGAVKSEIFIEKVCDSKYLRSSISNDISARADLIEELDELVSQNRKYRLIGWFTSSTDNSLEIPEGLMKIHRSFFKEKWQIGILLNPGSDVLQGAGFLRRKSGYLDPMPDPASFVKWDELYRFALNPTNSSRNDPERQNRNDKDYSRIALNNTWGDSVVTAVNFNLPVVGEITTAAASQAIPRDSFQVVGYLYGKAEVRPGSDGKTNEYEVFVDRFIELSNELTPRELPGFSLIGWWGQANVDVMNYLQQAVDYHEQSFREAYQISCLVNPSTGELRIFSRKHSLEMNNSTIETEEYSLKGLLSL